MNIVPRPRPPTGPPACSVSMPSPLLFPPPPAARPLPENRQVYFEPGCIQDPFSYPFAGVVPSLSPSELSCGLPLPPVPSPLSTASSPPSPPPRAPGGAASTPLPSAVPLPAACSPTKCFPLGLPGSVSVSHRGREPRALERMATGREVRKVSFTYSSRTVRFTLGNASAGSVPIDRSITLS